MTYEDESPELPTINKNNKSGNHVIFKARPNRSSQVQQMLMNCFPVLGYMPLEINLQFLTRKLEGA
jgi:hypothetical protein